ncbi:MAG: penicillin acylase family protein [Alphaproteobacteria bacterium]
MTTIKATGLTDPVEIVIDRWGVPHIRAHNIDDLFFAQGFNAARDRLWQIDLWRKRGLGLLAHDFGPGYAAQDRASRLFLYRGDMAAEWASYGDDAEAICTAFVRGINSYIELLDDHPDWLPPEFVELGTRPARWRPEDVVRIRVHSWMRNALSEAARARVMAKADAGVDLLRQNLDPPRVPTPAEGLDLASLPDDMLNVFKLAMAPVTFSRERLDAGVDEIEQWATVAAGGAVERTAASEGSNNWTVSPQRTDTGRPILANDPHRAHAVPALRYLVHLSSPEFDGIGAGEPVIPGIMMGHNGEIAFGLTLFFGVDSEDVYVYETEPGRPRRYRYGDGWEEMTTIRETIAVRGAPDQEVTLTFTRHGPVVKADAAANRAFAIRSTWFEPGSAPYMASIASMRARDHTAFRREMRRWAVPAVNMVFADRKGDISWSAVGRSPIRRNWDGLLPVPGDGRFEWEGFFNADDLPNVLNPKAGYFATANEMNVPADWPHHEKQIGFEWFDRSRATRIAEAFAATPRVSVASSCALQTDDLSIPARRITALLHGLQSDDAGLVTALALLTNWDCSTGPDSPEAALFEVWWTRFLRPAVIARAMPDEAVRSLMAPGDPDGIAYVLEHPGALFEGGAEARDGLLLKTLGEALRDCRALMGEDTGGWAWGRLHHGYFPHDLTPLRGSVGAEVWDVGPLPVGGTESTPMNMMYRATDFRAVLGATVRMVIDVGGWDNSRWINSPGQSGDPRSPHYADLAGLWSQGDYVPMLYSRAAVDAAAERVIRLVPQNT